MKLPESPTEGKRKEGHVEGRLEPSAEPHGDGCARPEHETRQQSYPPVQFEAAPAGPIDDRQTGQTGEGTQQLSRGWRTRTQAVAGGEHHDPQEVGVAFYSFPRIEDQPVPATQILGIAEGDKGIVHHQPVDTSMQEHQQPGPEEAQEDPDGPSSQLLRRTRWRLDSGCIRMGGN